MIEYFMVIFLTMLGIFTIFTLRSLLVHRFRIKLIYFTYANRNYMHRKVWLDSLSRDKMLYKFWKPLKSFLKNTKYEKEYLDWEKND